MSRANGTLDFDDIPIGKDHTAVLGTVKADTLIDGKVIATLTVDSMKQGGVNSVAFTPGADVDVIFTEAFQRNYEEKTGKTVSSVLSESREVLISIKRSLRTGENQVNLLKVK